MERGGKMEWISWAQGFSPAVKFLITVALLLLVAAGLSVFWRNPQAHTTLSATKSASEQPSTPINMGGINNGIIAGTYNAASSQSEELAREQLADLRERRAREERETARAADQAKRDAPAKERAAESAKVGQTIDRLRHEYVISHDGLSSALLAGLEPVPDDWMNDRLRQLGVAYTYHGNPDGGYSYGPKK
jgi:hypothetical protein